MNDEDEPQQDIESVAENSRDYWLCEDPKNAVPSPVFFEKAEDALSKIAKSEFCKGGQIDPSLTAFASIQDLSWIYYEYIQRRKLETEKLVGEKGRRREQVKKIVHNFDRLRAFLKNDVPDVFTFLDERERHFLDPKPNPIDELFDQFDTVIEYLRGFDGGELEKPNRTPEVETDAEFEDFLKRLPAKELMILEIYGFVSQFYSPPPKLNGSPRMQDRTPISGNVEKSAGIQPDRFSNVGHEAILLLCKTVYPEFTRSNLSSGLSNIRQPSRIRTPG